MALRSEQSLDQKNLPLRRWGCKLDPSRKWVCKGLDSKFNSTKCGSRVESSSQDWDANMFFPVQVILWLSRTFIFDISVLENLFITIIASTYIYLLAWSFPGSSVTARSCFWLEIPAFADVLRAVRASVLIEAEVTKQKRFRTDSRGIGIAKALSMQRSWDLLQLYNQTSELECSVLVVICQNSDVMCSSGYQEEHYSRRFRQGRSKPVYKLRCR